MAKSLPELEEYQYGFRDKDVSVVKFEKGLIAQGRRRDFDDEKRTGLDDRFPPAFARDSSMRKACRNGAAICRELDFDDITYYVKPSEKQGKTWEEVPEEIKNTFDRLGIPEAEQKFLAGVSAQYESEVVYHSMRKDLEEAGRPVHGHGHGASRIPGDL